MIEVENFEEKRRGLAKLSLSRRVGISPGCSWMSWLSIETGWAFSAGETGKDGSFLDHSDFQQRGNL